MERDRRTKTVPGIRSLDTEAEPRDGSSRGERRPTSGTCVGRNPFGVATRAADDPRDGHALTLAWTVAIE